MVASIIKTTKIANLSSTGDIELIRWGYIENATIIITSSIPCIRSLIISSVRKVSGVARSYELSEPFSAHRTRTGANDTTGSSLAWRFNVSHSSETGSVDCILDHGRHTTTTVGGRRD